MKRLLNLLTIGAVSLLMTTGFSPSTQSSTERDARKSLDAVNQEIVRACQQRNNDAVLALWAEDGADLLPGLAPMVGKANIAAWLESLRPLMQGTKMLSCTIDWQDIQIHGDLVYEWGINRQVIEFPPPKNTVANEGKIIFILRRKGDGPWKIALESWNSNPVPPEKH